jgi:hypothetical protein
MVRKTVSARFVWNVVALTVLLALAHPSVAQGPGWTALGKVIRIVSTSNGGFNVRMSPELAGCVSQSNYGPNYASFPPSHPGLNRMKADVLVAFTTEADIRLYLIDSNCTVGEMVIGGSY